MPQDPVEPCHDQILRVFAAEDLMPGLQDDAALLARPFRVVDGHPLEQTLRLSEARYAIEGCEVQLAGGFRFRGAVDPGTLRLLQRCDRRTPAGAVVEDLSGSNPDDRARLASLVAATVRKMVVLGFLVPSLERAGDVEGAYG